MNEEKLTQLLSNLLDQKLDEKLEPINHRLDKLEMGMGPINSRLTALESGFEPINNRLGSLESGLDPITHHLEKLDSSMEQLKGNLIHGLGPYFEKITEHIDQSKEELKETLDIQQNMIDTLSSRSIQHEGELKDLKKIVKNQ